MNYIRSLLFSILILSIASIVWAADDPAIAGKKLAQQMDDVDNSVDSISSGVMTITRDGKILTRSFDLFTKQIKPNKEEERVLFVFNEPAEVKGITYLEWTYQGTDKDDDLWVYLPSESMTRRISGSSMFSSFMRSDLANEDLKNMDDVEEYTYEIQGSETVDGKDCYILTRTAIKQKDTQYSRQVQWVRKDNLLREKIEYYDKKNKLLKTMYFLTCDKIDGIWTTTKLKIDKADGTSSTVVDWSKIQYNVGLKDQDFEQSRLHR
ncbi:MAG: outer membrane lipoprotein-sorting protein [Deltaproteobacteria bacterium]|jgi:outer membrane lipoprotein-sorting protein|nr:outer membrane lipoprotein-sorting protein [Deltaproteobacteria bacterium]